MPINNEDFHTSLYDLLRTKGYDPIPLDSKGNTTPFYPEADIFKFSFVKDGKKYGDVWATVDNALKLVLYYDDAVSSSPDDNTSGTPYSDSWPALIKHLKKWAQRRQLSFELKNKDHLVSDMAQREYMKKKERLGEGYYSMGKKASYNDAIPQVKIVIQHTKQIEEGEQRFRNVDRIFVENTDGERFAIPTKKPGLAKVYARHVAEGGTPYDDRGRHLTTLIEEYNKMVGFVRATKTGEFNESVQRVVNAGIDHYQSLRESLGKLTSHRGYHSYFDSWSPVLNEEQSDITEISTLFTKSNLDPRIESCIPILSKLTKLDEIKPVKELDSWADEVIRETTSIDLSREGPTSVMPGAGKNTRTSREKDRERAKALSHYSKELAADHYGKELNKSEQGVAEGIITEDPLLIQNLVKKLYSFFSSKNLPVKVKTDWDPNTLAEAEITRRGTDRDLSSGSVAPIRILTPKAGNIIAVKFNRETVERILRSLGNRWADRGQAKAAVEALLNQYASEIKKFIPDTMEVAFQNLNNYDDYTILIRMKTTKKGGYAQPGTQKPAAPATAAPANPAAAPANPAAAPQRGVAEGDVVQGPWGRKPTFNPEIGGQSTSAADKEPTGLRQVLQDKYSQFDNITITWKSKDQLAQEVEWEEGEEYPPNLIGEFEVKFEEESDEGYTMEVSDTWSVKSKNHNGGAPYELKRTARISAEMESLDPQPISEDFKNDLKKVFGMVGLAGAIGYGAWLNHLATYDTPMVHEIVRQAQAGDKRAIEDLRNISLRDKSTVEMDRLLNRYGFRSEYERRSPEDTHEGLNAQQKKAGQLGPTEKAKNISPVLGSPQHKHPFNGKLVGNESIDLGRLQTLIKHLRRD